MAFETFTKRMIPLAKEPYATVQKKGIISLNAPAHQLLGGPRAVELLYDADEQLIGLRPVDQSVEHAYLIRGEPGQATSFLLSGTAFVKHYGIDVSQSVRRPVKMIDGMLVIDLKDPGTVVTGNRQPKASAKAADHEIEQIEVPTEHP